MASDAVTTSQNSHRRIEFNSLLANEQGRPNMPLIIGVKLATCGTLIVTQEKWKHDKMWTGFNIGTITTLGVVSWQNLEKHK